MGDVPECVGIRGRAPMRLLILCLMAGCMLIGSSVADTAPPVVPREGIERIPVPGVVWPVALASADVNGDGAMDFAIADRGAEPSTTPTKAHANVTVLLSGRLGGYARRQLVIANQSPGRIWFADINADGVRDLVVLTDSNAVIGYPVLNGAIGKTARTLIELPASNRVDGLVIGRSGELVLVVGPSRKRDFVTVYRSLSAFQLRVVGTLRVAADWDLLSIAGDSSDAGSRLVLGFVGLPNVGGYSSGHIVTMIAGSGKRFVTHGSFRLPRPLLRTALADLNGDGVNDLVGTEDPTLALTIRFGSSNGQFGVPHPVAGGKGLLPELAADTNGDARDEVVGRVGSPSREVAMTSWKEGKTQVSTILSGVSVVGYGFTEALAIADGNAIAVMGHADLYVIDPSRMKRAS